jgi:hypothetical protein
MEVVECGWNLFVLLAEHSENLRNKHDRPYYSEWLVDVSFVKNYVDDRVEQLLISQQFIQTSF